MAYEWSPGSRKENDVLEFAAIRCLYQSRTKSIDALLKIHRSFVSFLWDFTKKNIRSQIDLFL